MACPCTLFFLSTATPSGKKMATEFATLGGGCFWCLEALFQELKGVESVVSGYSGGTVENPTYELVSGGTTGHAEVIGIRFDSDVISYSDILRIFFAIHDPTTLDRQGNNVGPQYRSIVFYHSADQKNVAEEILAEVGQNLSSPVVTRLEEFKKFYPAEDFLQNFFRSHPDQTYCQFVISPKMARFREHYANYLKP